MSTKDDNGQTSLPVGSASNPEVLPPVADSEDQKKVGKLTSLLQNVQAGWKVSIYRERPSWCRGHLESFEVYDDAPINIDDLVAKWGGQSLVLKIHNERGQWVGGSTIPLFSHAPKYHGKELSQEQVMGFGTHFSGPAANPAGLSAPAPVPVPGALPSPIAPLMQTLGMSLPELLKMMKGSNESENKVLMSIVERQLLNGAQQQQVPPQPMAAAPNPVDMLRQQMELMTMMREFAGMFGEGGGGGGGGDDLTGMLGTIAQGLMNKPQQQAQPRPQRRPRARIMPPPQSSPPRPQAPAQPVSAPVPVAQPEPESTQQFGMDTGEVTDEMIDSMGNSLSKLNPHDASDVVMTAFNEMDDTTRQEAMKLFIEKASGDPVDETSYVDDTYSQDAHPTNYDQSQEISGQGHTPSSQGGSVPTDAGNHPPDRDGNQERKPIPPH